ncbi:MAG: Oligopeptide transport system permease protein OppC [Gammaproteobacteria bacterium]|nr:Oligopeptide transport system permease protein OppC [Gammaproteobacteria bacterium]
MFTLFWTDALIFLLLIMVALFTWYARRKEHLRSPWRRVGRSRAAMSTMVILLAYVAIGLLDSVHFRPTLDRDGEAKSLVYSNEAISAFDWLASDLMGRAEKTYSAPFATHLYSKETVQLPDGTQKRMYPKLEYGGAHLAGPGEKAGDIIAGSLRGGVKGLLVWIAAVAVFCTVWGRRHGRSPGRAVALITSNQTEFRWRATLITLGVLFVLMWISTELSAKYHVFGTDKVGEDVFYQTLKSIRTGLMIGTLTTLVMLPFALILGIMAGYLGGWIDDVIQYLYTTLNSIPGVLLIAAAILMLQVYLNNNSEEFASVAERADLRLLFLCLILGITSWTGLCRYLRAESLKLREIDYVEAARSLGVGQPTIMFRHLLPNVMHIVLITVVLDFSGLVLAEAILSYVQIGVDPTMNSWGNMINSARLEMAREPIVWWSLLAAFVFMFVLVLSANLFSDTVRDAFDPRLRGVE